MHCFYAERKHVVAHCTHAHIFSSCSCISQGISTPLSQSIHTFTLLFFFVIMLAFLAPSLVSELYLATGNSISGQTKNTERYSE